MSDSKRPNLHTKIAELKEVVHKGHAKITSLEDKVDDLVESVKNFKATTLVLGVVLVLAIIGLVTLL